VLSQADRQIAEAFSGQLDAYLAPAETKWISARVAGLLAHFFVPDMPPQLQLAVLSDWIEALRPYPKWAIELEVRNWLSTNTRKPSIADITRAAQETIHFAERQRGDVRKLLQAQPRLGLVR
jgi:hypothetical protein